MAEKMQRVVNRRIGKADQTLKIQDMMGEASHEALNQLFIKHPAVSDMRTSPTPDELDHFCNLLYETDYVQGLFKSGQLRKAIILLEQGYQAFRSGACVPVTDAVLIEQKRKEREVRFIMRVAVVLGPTSGRIQIPVHIDQNKRQKEFIMALKQARDKLSPLLEDEFFREGLAADGRVARLERLLDDMTKASTWLTTTPYRPVKKQDKKDVEDSTAATRQIANRLADAAFRIYANCDENIMKFLLHYKWLEPISVAKKKELIEEARECKYEQYARSSSNEGYDGPGLYGPWTVSREIDPPWMTA